MKSLKIAVLPGDGIGPEVMDVTLNILEYVADKHSFLVEFRTADVGGIAIDHYGKALPDATIDICSNSDAILFGSVGGPKWENLPPQEQPERAALLPLRKQFSLYANIRPGLLYPELSDYSPLKKETIQQGIDVVCIRELTGGLYFGQPKETKVMFNKDVQAIDTLVYKKSEILRITEAAIRIARQRKKKICLVDKANVLESSVLWRKTVKDEINTNASDIDLSFMYVDNAAMQLVKDPNQFDVILTENLFGDILSDIMGTLCGSLGMLASASLGVDKNSKGLPFGLFEPSGGTAPDIAGKGIANPCAQILSAALMLRYSFGLTDAAMAIEKAVKAAIYKNFRTADITSVKDAVGTKEMGEAIMAQI